MRAIARFATTFCITTALSFGASLLPKPTYAGDVPTFAVDASWPKPLPNNWIIGQIGGITVDWQGHIWVVQRPRSLTDGEKAVTLSGTKVAVPPSLRISSSSSSSPPCVRATAMM